MAHKVLENVVDMVRVPSPNFPLLFVPLRLFKEKIMFSQDHNECPSIVVDYVMKLVKQ